MNNNNQERPSRVQLYDSKNKKRGTAFKNNAGGHHPKKPGHRGKRTFKILLGILLAILLVSIIVFIVKQQHPVRTNTDDDNTSISSSSSKRSSSHHRRHSSSTFDDDNDNDDTNTGTATYSYTPSTGRTNGGQQGYNHYQGTTTGGTGQNTSGVTASTDLNKTQTQNQSNNTPSQSGSNGASGQGTHQILLKKFVKSPCQT